VQGRQKISDVITQLLHVIISSVRFLISKDWFAKPHTATRLSVVLTASTFSNRPALAFHQLGIGMVVCVLLLTPRPYSADNAASTGAAGDNY
jgi:hypothetical protein